MPGRRRGRYGEAATRLTFGFAGFDVAQGVNLNLRAFPGDFEVSFDTHVETDEVMEV